MVLRLQAVSWSRHCIFMLRPCLLLCSDNFAIEVFVSWPSAPFVLQTATRRVFSCRDRVFMCCDRVWPWARILCCDKVFLCCDRVGQGEEKLCHDIVFFVSR